MDEGDVLRARRFIDPWNFERPPGHERASVVCPYCPRPWGHIPYRLFLMPHDARAHLRRHKTHELTFWCADCGRLEDPHMTSRWDPLAYNRQDPLVRGMLEPSSHPLDVLPEAIDFRRSEIQRLEREIATLEDLVKVHQLRERETA